MKNRNELEKEYAKLARRADDRLRSIEKLSQDPEFAGVKEYAYKSAIKTIERFGGTNRFGRGKRSMPKTDRKLQAKINAINKFLNTPSSTKTGIIAIYMDRTKTINEAYGTKFTWQSLATFFEMGRFEKLEELLVTSDDVFNVVAEIHASREKIIEALENSDGKTIKLDKEDRILQKSINKILADEEGKDILKILLDE